jgi:hypothetical protein
MRRFFVVAVLLIGVPARAASQPSPEPRFLIRLDAALLTSPNTGAGGSGGGIEIPLDGGTGAGLLDAGGVELGCEVRLSRWLALDIGTGWYGPDLEVTRGAPGSGQQLDDRSAAVDLRLIDAGLVIAPPKLRGPQWRLAFGVLAVRSSVSGLPSSVGLAVDDDTGLGLDARGEIYLSKNRRWGLGMALVFSDVGPSFTDLETGATGELQVSGFLLRLGARGRW